MTEASSVQLVNGNETLVVVHTLKVAPGVFEKDNWKVPVVENMEPARIGGMMAG